MEIYKISYENEKELIIGIRSIDYATISAIMDYLSNDEDVSLVRYVETHPELDDPQLVIVTRDGSAKDALIRAADSVTDYFSGINSGERRSNKSGYDGYKVDSEERKHKVDSEERKHKVDSVGGSITNM